MSNYLDNADLYAEIIKFKQTNVISNNLGSMIMKMCFRITWMKFFKGYDDHEKDDMRSGAYIDALNALYKFNINKKNPFAYFTQVITNSYRQYLKSKYNYSNFKMDLIEAEFVKANKKFTNEIKKDMILNRKEKEKRALKAQKTKDNIINGNNVQTISKNIDLIGQI